MTKLDFTDAFEDISSRVSSHCILIPLADSRPTQERLYAPFKRIDELLKKEADSYSLRERQRKATFAIMEKLLNV